MIQLRKTAMKNKYESAIGQLKNSSYLDTFQR